MNLKMTGIWSLFIGQSYFNNDGTQLYLMFGPIYQAITTFSGTEDITSEQESMGFLNEKITCAYVANVNVSP